MSKKNSPSSFLRVAAVQMNSNNNKDHNKNQLIEQINQLNSSVELLVLPEVFNFRSSAGFDESAAESLSGETISFLKQCSQNKNVYIIAGSITEKTITGKVYNTTVVINPNGDIIGTYRKIHLFDVDLKSGSIKESHHFQSGAHPVMVTINGWRIGLSICYDLRFPELYRHYFLSDADMVVVPSSFTYETGQKHWHTLCRARAIENQCYLIAPNQCGVGAMNVKTYGHSLIIDPDGMILAEGNDSDSMVLEAKLLKQSIAERREAVPIKRHQKNHLL